MSTLSTIAIIVGLLFVGIGLAFILGYTHGVARTQQKERHHGL